MHMFFVYFERDECVCVCVCVCIVHINRYFVVDENSRQHFAVEKQDTMRVYKAY